MQEKQDSTDIQILQQLSRIGRLVSELRQNIINRSDIDWREVAKIDRILAIQVLVKQRHCRLLEASRIVDQA
jgi:hypothetical protein